LSENELVSPGRRRLKSRCEQWGIARALAEGGAPGE